MGELFKILDRLGGTGRLVVAGVGLATVAAVFYLVMSAKPASDAPLYTNLTPKQAGQIQASLAGAGITSTLGASGTSVLVPSSKIADARVAVATDGLTTGGEHEGWDLVDGLGMGATQFQQDVSYQRALEGELANQLQEVAGVDHATVNLNMQKQSLFLADQQQPTASVQLGLGGTALSPESVSGMAQLVAKAVTGLTVKNVVITNERGELLTQTGDGIGDAAASKLATEANYSRRMEANAQALLDRMLGTGQAAVVVNAHLGLDQVSEKRVTYGNKSIPVSKSSDVETLKNGAKSTAKGTAGTATNVAGYAGTTGTGTGGTGDYKHAVGSEQTAVDSTVTETTRAGGDPTALFVSVAFAGAAGSGPAPKLTPTQSAAANAVKAYLGITAADLKAGTSTFQTAVSAPAATTGAKTGTATGGLAGATPALTPTKPGMLDQARAYLKPGLTAAGLLLLLFVVRRSLRRRQALLGASEARWMPNLSAPPIPIEELALPAGPSAAELEGASKKALQARVEDLAAAKPAEVAQQLRGWLSEDS
jgi:flagellar M-ring protein FliF